MANEHPELAVAFMRGMIRAGRNENAPGMAPRGVEPGVAARRESAVAQSVSTRTLVGAGMPAAPP